MYLIKLILKNALRHKLRTLLTVVGLIVAVVAFGLLQTVVGAWYAGAEGASSARLVTRNAISLVFPLPLTYRQKLRSVDGVRQVSNANWFGGIYKEAKNFFPQFAVDAPTYFQLYPEYVIAEDEIKAFLRDRKGAVVGRKLAHTYGFKVGDTVTLKGTIFPGNWEFVMRAIYDGRDAKTDTSQFFFHWDYLNETLKKTVPRRANTVGVYVLRTGRSRPRRGSEPGGGRAVQEFHRRDADRDREGVPALLRLHDRGHRGGDPRRVLPRDLHHHGGHGQHHGDDRARAAVRIRDAEGAGLRSGFPGAADHRRIAGDRSRRRAGRRGADVSRGARLRRSDGIAVSGVPGEQ